MVQLKYHTPEPPLGGREFRFTGRACFAGGHFSQLINKHLLASLLLCETPAFDPTVVHQHCVHKLHMNTASETPFIFFLKNKSYLMRSLCCLSLSSNLHFYFGGRRPIFETLFRSSAIRVHSNVMLLNFQVSNNNMPDA
jgi:hypothetical protein